MMPLRQFHSEVLHAAPPQIVHRESRLRGCLPSANMASWCTRPSEEARVAGRRRSADGERSGKRKALRASFYFAGLKSRASTQEKDAGETRSADAGVDKKGMW